MNKIVLAVSIVVLSVAVCCGVVALMYSYRHAANEEIMRTARTYPSLLRELNSELASRITLFQSASIFLAISGCALLVASLRRQVVSF